MNRFENIKQIGEGTYGRVYKAQYISDPKVYAIKQVKLSKDNGLPTTTVREVKILKKLKSINIIELVDIYIQDSSIYIIMEYMPFDLSGLTLNKYLFTKDQFKSFSYQLISAASFIHSINYIHRDIKSSNILINRCGVLKLADFGLTREIDGCMTNRICTMWYRAPELLLGETNYGVKIDSWSIACVLIEMRLGVVPFKGTDEISQVKEIFETLGVPEETFKWTYLFDIDKYKRTGTHSELMHDRFVYDFDIQELELISELLRLLPTQRISAKNALKLKMFRDYVCTYIPIEFTDVHDFYCLRK